MLVFFKRKNTRTGKKHPVDKLWITQGFSVDNPVSKLWMSCGRFEGAKLSTEKSTAYPQGYSQGYPQVKWVLLPFVTRG